MTDLNDYHISEVRGGIINNGGHMVFLGPVEVVIGATRLQRCPVAPNPIEPLIGRDQESTRLEADLAVHQTVIVTGPSGIGKTTLVLDHASHGQQTGHYGAVFWLSFRQHDTPQEALRRLERQALPDSAVDSGGPPEILAQQVQSRLTDLTNTYCAGACLVVIDDVEVQNDHHLALIHYLREALPREARCIMLTRDAPLALQGHRFFVPPLNIVDASNLLKRWLRTTDTLLDWMVLRVVAAAKYLPQTICEHALSLNNLPQNVEHILGYVQKLPSLPREDHSSSS